MKEGGATSKLLVVPRYERNKPKREQVDAHHRVFPLEMTQLPIVNLDDSPSAVRNKTMRSGPLFYYLPAEYLDALHRG
jgi:hypothetical protein